MEPMGSQLIWQFVGIEDHAELHGMVLEGGRMEIRGEGGDAVAQDNGFQAEMKGPSRRFLDTDLGHRSCQDDGVRPL